MLCFYNIGYVLSITQIIFLGIFTTRIPPDDIVCEIDSSALISNTIPSTTFFMRMKPYYFSSETIVHI